MMISKRGNSLSHTDIRTIVHVKKNSIKVKNLNKILSSKYSWQERVRWINRINSYTGKKGENLEWLTISNNSKAIALEKMKMKSKRMRGKNNPGYQHGGKLSPFSKNFKKYNDGSAKYNIDDVLSKMKSMINERPENQNTKKEYYINRGYSEEDAISELSKRQSTFSLEKCINKYGVEHGNNIWQKRQDKWQNSLNAKTQEEIDIINQGRGTGRMNQLFNSNPEIKKVPGILYYLRFFSEDIEFWKIGITSRSIEQRFPDSKIRKYGLSYEIVSEDDSMNFYDCFKKEQSILRENKKYRININYNGFSTTEAFCKNVI